MMDNREQGLMLRNLPFKVKNRIGVSAYGGVGVG